MARIGSACQLTPIRRYSRVRMARNRGATAGSQGISRERQRSMAARKSRRNATQDGHASICSRICSQVRGSTLPSRYSERLANRSRHSAGRCRSWLGNLWLLRDGSCILRSLQERPAGVGSSPCARRDVPDEAESEPFPAAAREPAQPARWSTPPYRGAPEQCARSAGRARIAWWSRWCCSAARRLPSGPIAASCKQSPQFFIVRHQLVERKEVGRGVSGLAAHAPAAVSSDGVKPNGHLLRSLNFGKVLRGSGRAPPAWCLPHLPDARRPSC